MSEPWACFGSDSEDEADSKPVAVRLPLAPAAVSKRQQDEAWKLLVPQLPAGGVMPLRASEDKRAPAAAPFTVAPAFQHPCLRFTELPHRGGGRGFVVDRDVPAGTLLLAEAPLLRMPTAGQREAAGTSFPKAAYTSQETMFSILVFYLSTAAMQMLSSTVQPTIHCSR
jgi:hypothetical protein